MFAITGITAQNETTLEQGSRIQKCIPAIDRPRSRPVVGGTCLCPGCLSLGERGQRPAAGVHQHNRAWPSQLRPDGAVFFDTFLVNPTVLRLRGKTTGAEQRCEDGARQEVGSCLIPGPRLDQKARKADRFSGAAFLIWTKVDPDSFCRFLLSA